MRMKNYNNWLKEFYEVAEMRGFQVNVLDPDHYYDYYDNGLSPSQAIYEEVKEFFYEEDIE